MVLNYDFFKSIILSKKVVFLVKNQYKRIAPKFCPLFIYLFIYCVPGIEQLSFFNLT